MGYLRHPDQPDKLDIAHADGVTVRSMFFRHAGMMVPQHSHAHGHLTVVATGEVRVFADDVLLGHFAAPETIKIPARVKHRFETLVPDTLLLCIHNADHGGCGGCGGCVVVDGVPVHEMHVLEGAV